MTKGFIFFYQLKTKYLKFVPQNVTHSKTVTTKPQYLGDNCCYELGTLVRGNNKGILISNVHVSDWEPEQPQEIHRQEKYEKHTFYSEVIVLQQF